MPTLAQLPTRVMSLVVALSIAVVSQAQLSFWTPSGSSRADAPTVEVNEFATWHLDMNRLEVGSLKLRLERLLKLETNLDSWSPDARWHD